MMMMKGQVYRCMNRSCNCEVVVSRGSDIEGNSNPRCCCGSEMKKPFSIPVLHEFTGTHADRVRALFEPE